ncbi:lysophospholipid acyltransferase family protein [Granulicella arctica]|uniref:1-acyl-sn-glycerol-3-phosphate acyltransferase n=1 Tax=Granulicella arctica TaxID=940613 RepID=A0A7Y9PEW0_9BACT|nr:lysophospholipid acyltransferase family protein [Granulicella arctica]NYF78638.1 1-acyl-sn-glycerol-3-phosphate acyltransferase [Granulicella arctica]
MTEEQPGKANLSQESPQALQDSPSHPTHQTVIPSEAEGRIEGPAFAVARSSPTPPKKTVILSEGEAAAEGPAVAFARSSSTPPQKTVILSEGEAAAEGPAVALAVASSSSPPPPTQKRSFTLRWLTYLVFIPLMAASTTFFGCISLLCGLWDTSGRQQHFIARIWGKSLLIITLSPVELIGAEKLRLHQQAVYASNHLSYMDTPVLFAKLPFQFRIFAKSSLWKIPFIGWYLNRSGQVPIDQKSSRTAIAGLLKGVGTIKSGLPLVLFPEGGRAEDGQLQTLMPGCAFMAIRAGVPLIPIALIGTYELLPIHTYHLHPRPLKLVVGDPIPTNHLTTRDADALTDQLYQAISTLYTQHS